MDILAKIQEIKRKREELERELLSLPDDLYEAKYEEYYQKNVLLEKEEYRLKDSLLTDEVRKQKRNRIQELKKEMEALEEDENRIENPDKDTTIFYMKKYTLLNEEKYKLEYDLMSEEERELERDAARHLGKKMDY